MKGRGRKITRDGERDGGKEEGGGERQRGGWAKHMEQYLTKDDIQRPRKYITRCSVSSAIRDMLIKTTLE